MLRPIATTLLAGSIGVIGLAAYAQGQPLAGGALATPDWSIETPTVKPEPRKKKKGAAAPAGPARASSEQQERAAHEAEARRKFFADKPDPPSNDPHNFTGLDSTNGLYQQNTGGFRPGGQFKF